jgi:hypothetical protein
MVESAFVRRQFANLESAADAQSAGGTNMAVLSEGSIFNSNRFQPLSHILFGVPQAGRFVILPTLHHQHLEELARMLCDVGVSDLALEYSINV